MVFLPVQKRSFRALFVATIIGLLSTTSLNVAVAETVINQGGGKATTTTEVVTNKKLSPMLVPDSVALARAAVDRYADIVSGGGFPKVPRGIYSRGKQSASIEMLNKRLYLEGYVPDTALTADYSVLTEQGVAKFQRNMGLAVTGKVDGTTLAALNVPAGARLRTLQANVARLEIYVENLGNRYLVVNVPSQTIEAVSNGRIYSRHNAIVGRPERPTPVVMTSLKTVRFNPYWHAPVSIVEKDIFPKIQNGTKYLEEHNIKVFKGYGGEEIDPTEVDWSTAVPDDYLFRQEPGPDNAMATAKIEFPSPFGIYLHDTPEKNLFKSGNRLFSSGCVRVENMPLLVKWVMNGQSGFDADKIAVQAETLERIDEELVDPAQLRVTYLTAWPLSDGTVAFRKDVYDLDESGFTVGQPLPVGELSEEGLRYVLKPVPRQAAQVEAAEAEGIGIFGSRKASKTTPKPKKPLAGDETDEDLGVFVTSQKSKPGMKKLLKTVVADDGDIYSGDDTTVSAKKPLVGKTLFGQNTTRTKIVPEKPVSFVGTNAGQKPAGKKRFLFDDLGKSSAGGTKPKGTVIKSSLAVAKPKPLELSRTTSKTTQQKSLFGDPNAANGKKKAAADAQPGQLVCSNIVGVGTNCSKTKVKPKKVAKVSKVKPKPAASSN